ARAGFVGLLDDLGPGPVAVDTSICIYFIEDHARYAPTIAPLFEAADRGERMLVTSALTLMEVLVVPYRLGNAAMIARYEALLGTSRGLLLIDPTRDQWRAAARICAVHGARTPDALQLAAALGTGCTSFLTNDRRLPAIAKLRVLQLAA